MPIFDVTFRLIVDDVIGKPEVENWADNVMAKFREDEKDSYEIIRLVEVKEVNKELYIDEDTLFRTDK